MVDFPDHPPAPETQDAGADTGTQLDGASDARRDTQPPESDASDNTCKSHASCDSNELCCPSSSGSTNLVCVATNVQRCIDCELGCTGDRAPNCGANRTCECVKGTNKGCDADQKCFGTGDQARCGECGADNDCAMMQGKPFCDAGKCVACKANTDCSGRTPICGPDKICIGCDDSTPATSCPTGQTCSPGLGCGGCKADQPIVGANGCAADSAAPICKVGDAGTSAMCFPCTNNTECKFAGGQGYCANGRCSNICDGDSPPGANGCTMAAKPICKAASNVPGGFDCAACADADCGTGTFCATTGAKAGSCVQCRTNADCPQNGLAPICDTTTFACRARTMADCTPPAVLNATTGQCVQCTSAAQCGGATPVCNPTTNTCVACLTSDQCPAAFPTCNPMNNTCVAGCTTPACGQFHASTPLCNAAGQCVQCLASAQCPVGPTPVCNATGACVACTGLPGSNADKDLACSTKTTGTRCFRPGNTNNQALFGYCGFCDSNADCVGGTMCNPTTLLCQ